MATLPLGDLTCAAELEDLYAADWLALLPEEKALKLPEEEEFKLPEEAPKLFHNEESESWTLLKQGEQQASLGDWRNMKGRNPMTQIFTLWNSARAGFLMPEKRVT